MAAHTQPLADGAHAMARVDAAHVALAITALAVIATVCAWRAWANFRRARLIEDTPTARVRSAPQGYVELEGVALPMEHTPLLARLSGLPCCWYRYRIERLAIEQQRGQTRRRWETIERGASTETFWLDDGTGRVAINPEGADLHPRHRDVWQGNSPDFGIAKQLPPFVTQFLVEHGAHRYRFTEERINPNDRLYALGLLKNLGSHLNGPTLDERIRELLRDWKQDQPRLHERFDLNRDGKIDEKEWLLARRAARRDAESAQARALSESAEGINLMTSPRDADRPYILSAWPQRELVRRKRWRAFGYGLVFLLAGSSAVWLYQARFA